LVEAMASSLIKEFDDLMLSLVGEVSDRPLPTPFAPDPPRAQGRHRPEGVTFENDAWRHVQRRRFFVATGEFVSTLFLLGLAPASCIDHCVQSLIKQQARACAHQAVPGECLQVTDGEEGIADSAKNAELPEVTLLSGGRTWSQPNLDDTANSLQERLGKELNVSEDRIRLICPNGAAIAGPDRLLDLGLKEQVLQVVVLPGPPKELLVECLCNLVKGLVEANAVADPMEARFAPLTSPLVVPAPVVNTSAKKVVTEHDLNKVRSELLEHCASHLNWAKDAKNAEGKPELGMRAIFLIEDTLELILHWQAHSNQTNASADGV